MLAAINDYVFIWQLPLVLALLAGWVFGGGYLLHRMLRGQPDAGRTGLGRCIQAIFLAGLGGGVGGGVLFALVYRIGKLAQVDLLIPAAIVSGLGMLGMAYLVIFAMFSLSAARTAKAAAPPVGAVLALAVVVGLACGLPARHLRLQKLQRDRTRNTLAALHMVLERYEAQHDAPPTSLQTLVDDGIAPALVRSPALPERDVGFFYHPPDAETLDDADRDTIIACEVASHDGGRMVLFADGRTEWLEEDAFSRTLESEPNRSFAEAMRAE
ncbi:MAG: hypothetical protein ACOC8F_03455 [Planctomycetota bacterium]